ncbi:hypothetical protein [Nitrococcus mobilis]|uniref:Uncharacterized protein n=1 Tax=Nitrococcus mobilis Nb-231 TaxID=314278 RepID=A4BPC9_9GAMM|nr:hypothetical protein [Nitrococcus mobilis]EAR22430.1 hypothetical protein NB231_11859 [Nitrococcus mobilis Nb-231]
MRRQPDPLPGGLGVRARRPTNGKVHGRVGYGLSLSLPLVVAEGLQADTLLTPVVP